jgi:excisionase family DNA binding protein
MNKLVKNKLLTPAEAAKILHVSPITIRYWAKEGLLPFFSTPGGHRRFNREDVINLLNSHSAKKELGVGFKVLIIDDDNSFSILISDMIKSISDDIQTYTSSSAFEAGELLQKIKPDLILLDLMMPSIDGFSVCHHIKTNEDTKKINVIAMTGFPSDENIDRIKKAGALTCLAKPISLKDINGAILPLL